MNGYEFYVDPSRCIGCRACETACAECDTHRGEPMIHVDVIDRKNGTATVPTVCMHCDDPTCAQVCPTTAIKKNEDGVVQSASKSRCIACSNCVVGCPFGVPKMMESRKLMMKCDLCYDRTSEGKRPMCATVCPSQALAYVPSETIRKGRRETPVNAFRFGDREVTTKVFMMAPAGESEIRMDVADYMWEEGGNGKQA